MLTTSRQLENELMKNIEKLYTYTLMVTYQELKHQYNDGGVVGVVVE